MLPSMHAGVDVALMVYGPPRTGKTHAVFGHLCELGLNPPTITPRKDLTQARGILIELAQKLLEYLARVRLLGHRGGLQFTIVQTMEADTLYAEFKTLTLTLTLTLALTLVGLH